MDTNSEQKTIIRNGTLINGTGQPAFENDALVIQGNRILSVGAVPPQINIEDRENVETIDATGKWTNAGPDRWPTATFPSASRPCVA